MNLEQACARLDLSHEIIADFLLLSVHGRSIGEMLPKLALATPLPIAEQIWPVPSVVAAGEGVAGVAEAEAREEGMLGEVVGVLTEGEAVYVEITRVIRRCRRLL